MKPRTRGRRELLWQRELSPPAPPARLVQLEDALLFVWLLAVETLFRPLLHALAASGPEAITSTPPWSIWLVVASLAFLVFTRGEADRSLDTGVLRRVLIVLPAWLMLSLVAAIVSLARGGPRSLRVLGGAEAEWPMPRAPEWLRRTAALPAILVGETVFRNALERARPSFEAAIAPAGPGTADWTSAWSRAADVGSELFVLAIPFLLMVVGPRVAAGATARWPAWLLRFLLFVAAATLGARLFGR